MNSLSCRRTMLQSQSTMLDSSARCELVSCYTQSLHNLCSSGA